MSRIGKQPVKLPAGVTVQIEGAAVRVKGPKGELARDFHKDMSIVLEGDSIRVERPSDEPYHRALHGLTRTLVSNMVVGVSKGFERALELVDLFLNTEFQGGRHSRRVGKISQLEVASNRGGKQA